MIPKYRAQADLYLIWHEVDKLWTQAKTLSNKLLLAKPLLKNGGIDQKGNHQQMSCENCMENQTQTPFLNLGVFMHNAEIIYFIPNALFEVF